MLRRKARRWLLYGLAGSGRLLVARRAAPLFPRRILVIKPDHLGDVLLSTPALRHLRQQHPQAHIVLLVGPWSAAMLARNPDVDTLLTLPFPAFERAAARRSRVQPYLLLFKTALLLRAGAFDTALLLRDDHWWGAALALLAGIPRRLGYAVPECRPLLTCALPWDPAQHVTRQALDVVQASGGSGSSASVEQIRPGVPPLRFVPAPADRAYAADWLTRHLQPGERLLVLHPGTGGAAKLWLPERWAAVASHLLEALEPQGGARLVLTGGKGEEPLVAAVARALPQPPLLLVGATTIGQLAALLEHAALVLGVDSGPLHLAVSQGTPSLHLFGPGDHARFGPWGDPTRHAVLRSELWCSPCGVFAACPRHTDPPECMALLDEALVTQAALRLLNDAHSPSEPTL